MSALISSYESVNNLLQLGWVANEKVSDVFRLLFLFFGCLGIWKFVKKAREAERLCLRAKEKAQKELENARVSERLYKELQIAYLNQGKQLEETTFPRTHLHREFHIKKDSAQNILNYIKGDMSSFPWTIMDRDKISYAIYYKESEFRYPDKDNTPVHGAYFSVIKDGKHFPRLFWISIISSGIGENTLSTVSFETQEKDMVDFFNFMRRRLVKHFVIWEPTACAG